MTLSHSSIFTESRSRSTASISLQSSSQWLSLSLSNLNLISLTLSLRHKLNSQVSNVLSISICLSLYLRQILKSKAWNLFTKSSSLTQTLSVSHSLISAVRQSFTPFTNFIRNLKSSLFQFSSIFNLHSLKALIFGLLTNEQTTLSKSQFSLCLSLLQGPNPSFSLQVLHT